MHTCACRSGAATGVLQLLKTGETQLIHTPLRVRCWQLVLALVSLRRSAGAAVVRSQHLVQAPRDVIVQEDAVRHLPQHQQRVNRCGPPPTMSQTLPPQDGV